MRTGAKIVVVAVILVAALHLLVPVPSEAQADLAKVLVGRWEGGAQAVLIFDSVRQEDGRWVAVAKFGARGQPPRPVNVTIDASGNTVTVQFKPLATIKWQLTLRGESVLDGVVRDQLRVSGGRTADIPVRLEKVR